MTEGDVSPQNDSVNVDEFAQIKANIPTTHTNPLKLIDASGLLEPAAASDEETVTFFEAIKYVEFNRRNGVCSVIIFFSFWDPFINLLNVHI